MSTVQNVARLLALFFDEPELGVREMSRRLGLDKSVVQRLARELTAREFLEQNPETRRYMLGIRLLELGGLVQTRNEPWSAAQPILQALTQAVGETSQFGILDHDGVVNIGRAESTRTESNRHGLWRVAPVGARARFHYTSIGKVILAYQPDAFVEQVIAHGLRRFTAHTIVEPEALRAELRSVRERGYAISYEELEIGLCSVGAPVRNEYGDVMAGLSITGPTPRLPLDRLQGLVLPVMEAAAQVSRRLGWAGARNRA